MVREDWYRHLARIESAHRRTRERIERLKVHISELENVDQAPARLQPVSIGLR